jgi:hypothetical protein
MRRAETYHSALEGSNQLRADCRALRGYRLMPDLRDAITAIIVRQKSCSRSTRSDIAQTHKFIVTESHGQLNLSFSVEIRPLAPAARASASISRISAGE